MVQSKMIFSFYTNPGDLNLESGYGLAGYGICSTLQRLGHKVHFDDPAAPVQINFCQPPFVAGNIRKNQHNIWLAVWESDLFHEDWYETIKEFDSIWTASDWCKDMLEDNGLKVSQVYPHGITPDWKPLKRKPQNKLRFLHDGEPAVRKGGQVAFDAFRAAFGDKDDVELTIKAKRSSLIREYDRNGSITGLPDRHQNVKIVTQIMELSQVIGLYHSHHVMVCPSYGEGFGFPALQGLATGMPTIATSEWAHYRTHLEPLGLASDYIESPWPTVHPGKVLKPDFDDLVDKYRYAYDNYDRLSNEFFNKSWMVHEEYDWTKLTEKSFKNIIEQFSS